MEEDSRGGERESRRGNRTSHECLIVDLQSSRPSMGNPLQSTTIHPARIELVSHRQKSSAGQQDTVPLRSRLFDS